MSTKRKPENSEKKEFKKKLKNLPKEVFDDFKNVLVKHGLKNVDVHSIKVTPLDRLTQEDCRRRGKRLHCQYDNRGRLRCWCV